MENKHHELLEKAKACAYSWKLQDAYNLFRRYFDRLPFAPEEGHAECIGLFVRVLFELGKEFELNFYLSELEKLYEKSPEPHIAYPLAVVYSYSNSHKMEAAKAIFEQIVKSPDAKSYHAKSKMMLADYYQRKNDYLACRLLIESIDPSDDVRLTRLVDIWKAVIARHAKQYDKSRRILLRLINEVNPEEDWYAFFSAKLVLGMLYIEMEDRQAAQQVVDEVREMFDKHRFKLVQVQIQSLENFLREKSGIGKIKVVQQDDDYLLLYAEKTLTLTTKSPGDRLLVQLIKKGFLDKAIIVKSLYERQYDADADDKLIYYHIHALRKRLKTIGIPSEAIENDGRGYRWVPEVEMVGGEA